VKQQACLDLASAMSLVFSSVAGPQFSSCARSSGVGGGLPFSVAVDAAMANGMPQLIAVASAESLTLTLTFNESAYPRTRELVEAWRAELAEAGLCC
jgi:hypothetical protein